MMFHPYSEVFPLIEGDDFDALVSDIKSNGLRDPIWLYGGKVLDGRNRFLACQKAKVKPQYRKFDGDDDDALALVISSNIHRRHLTFQQRAISAARVATLRVGRQSNASQDAFKSNTARAVFTQEEAAERFDVSTDSVQRAKKVIDHGSKALQHAVDTGEVPLKKAASVVQLPKAEQLQAAKAVDMDDERAALQQAEKEYAASIEKVMASDDRLSAAHAEIKRQAAEISSLKLSRNGYQNQCDELIRRIKSLQRQNDKLKSQSA